MIRALAGRDVSPAGLGCMGLSHGYGRPPSSQDALRILNAALDLGYKHSDTARLYGAGHSRPIS